MNFVVTIPELPTSKFNEQFAGHDLLILEDFGNNLCRRLVFNRACIIPSI